MCFNNVCFNWIGFSAASVAGYLAKIDVLNIVVFTILGLTNFIAFQLLHRSDLVLQEYKRRNRDA